MGGGEGHWSIIHVILLFVYSAKNVLNAWDGNTAECA